MAALYNIPSETLQRNPPQIAVRRASAGEEHLDLQIELYIMPAH